ncbi:energy transducer TonB [Fulvivirga sediminis]|uniref:Energy transducer TonB n=1 Tax=Fulvivirga sediminis TaxID=2803949 RepID=A0A937F4U4_9BACT|nr:energy transducer TonB [Fulvivirga sediminis]MBL3654719.1 energy transducer TonB [Fulvivirga sediminis]
MEKRKNPEKDVRRLSGLFFQIGLLAAIMLVVSAFEYRTAMEAPDNPVDLDAREMDVLETILPTVQVKEKPAPPPPVKKKIMNPIPDPDIQDVEEELKKTVVVELPPVEIEDPVIVENPLPEEKVDDTFLIVEKMPSPVGGESALYEFINKRLRYPGQARRIGVEGTVYLSFVVDKDGNMVDIQIAKGIGAGCDEEVLRIFEKNSPKWNPGKQRGVPVKVKQVIPVKFVLGER